MVYDPCNPVPDTNIPTGLPVHHPHAPHHVVGRIIKHRIHHKFVHMGPGAPPNPYGCEKHAAAGPGYGHGGLPASPIPTASNLAALGGAGAGLVAVGGLGGLIGGIIPGGGTIAKTPPTKVAVITPGGTTTTPTGTTPPPVTTTPVPTPITTTPITVPTPGNPPIAVPEPSSAAIFVVAVAMALAARFLLGRYQARISVRAA